MIINSIEKKKQLIHAALSHKINRDYVLYDIPNHRNIGDQLIYQGELDFLSSLKPKCLSSCSVSFNFLPIPTSDLILLHGGGNFGDIYPFHQKFREKIIASNKDKEIILFPNSVQFNNKNELERSAALFNEHPKITICARDEASYNLLRSTFINCDVLLLPDMAFCSKYESLKKPSKPLAIIQRTDVELQRTDKLLPKGDFEIIDWITFERSMTETLHLYYYSINRRFSEIWLQLKKENSVFGCFPLRTEKHFIREGIKQLSEYEFVISTRLHGHILALLLGIPSIMVDNNYGKNSRYYETWLKDIPNSFFAKDITLAINQYNMLNQNK